MNTEYRKTAGREPARKQGVFPANDTSGACAPLLEGLIEDALPSAHGGSLSATVLTPRPEAFALTMSSREIAELTESTHDNVLKTVRSLIERGVVSGNETPYIHPQNGQTYPEFRLSYRDTMVVVSGYSVELRARIIDRWQELESKQSPAPAIPQTLAQALRLAADQADQIERQREQLAIAAPKAAFVERYVESTGLHGFRQVAKLLGVKENRFSKFLIDKKIMYRLGREWMPCAKHLEAGRFEVKTGTSRVSGHAFNEAKFTPKGVEWIAGLLESERVSADLKGLPQ